MALDLTAIVLTYNEEIDLPACLDSLGRLECRVVVVDSGSGDRTVEIARQFGAEVFHHEFESQAQQLTWALDNVPMDAEWLLRLDADERTTPELADELLEKLARPAAGVTGLYVKRRGVLHGPLDTPRRLLPDVAAPRMEAGRGPVRGQVDGRAHGAVRGRG